MCSTMQGNLGNGEQSFFDLDACVFGIYAVDRESLL